MINKPRRIGPDDTIPLRLSEQERKLILDKVFDPENLFKRLRLGTVEGGRLVYRFTYDDIDLLLGAIAFASNHADDRNLQDRLDRVHSRISRVLDDYEVVDQKNSPLQEDPSGLVSMNLPGMDMPTGSPPPELEQALNQIIAEQGGINSLEDFEKALRTMFDRYARQAELEVGGMHPAHFEALVSDQWDGRGVVKLNHNLALDELAQAYTLVNARIFLNAILDSGGLKATAKGNLPRKFVMQMVDDMIWPEGFIENLWLVNKVLNEDDVFPLHIIRILLEMAGLVHKVKGSFRVKAKYKPLLRDASAGELFAILFRTHFQKFNLGYLDRVPEIPIFQHTIAYPLFILARIGNGWHRPEELTGSLLLPRVVDELPEFDYLRLPTWLIKHRLIQPLVSFGLLEKREVPSEEKLRTLKPYEVRKTPLFDRFLKFDFSEIPV